MSSRTVIDNGGRKWEVWDVRPTSAERRRFQDPRFLTAGDVADRRTHREARVKIAPGWEEGWLTFQCGPERRRLVPIPDGWDEAPDAGLLNMLDAAAPVVLRTQSASTARPDRFTA